MNLVGWIQQQKRIAVLRTCCRLQRVYDEGHAGANSLFAFLGANAKVYDLLCDKSKFNTVILFRRITQLTSSIHLLLNVCGFLVGVRYQNEMNSNEWARNRLIFATTGIVVEVLVNK